MQTRYNRRKTQQTRAWLAFQLRGLGSLERATEDASKYLAITLEESDKLRRIIDLRDELLEDFDTNSREVGLKTPEFRCWCRKPGIYPHPQINKNGFVCFKHSKANFYE